MKNWNIGARIGAGFAGVILIAIGLGLFAYSRVGGIEVKSSQISKESLPSVYAVGQIEKNAQITHTLLLEHLMSTNKDEMAGIQSEIANVRSSNAGFGAEYEKFLSSDRERSLYDNYKNIRNSYRGVVDQILRESHLGTAEAKKHAEQVLNAELKPLQKKYTEATAELMTFNKSAAEEDARAVEASVGSTRSGILIGIGLALVIAVILAVFIIRSITRPLATAVGLVEQVAQGDLTHTIDVTSKDELGRMLTAMNGMVRSLNEAALIAVKISDGDLSVEPKALSDKDALGQALIRMVANLQSVAQVAVKISEGDLSVQPKMLSAKDVLGQALIGMVENLRGAAQVASRISDGDLTAEARALSEKDVLGQALLRMLGNCARW